MSIDWTITGAAMQGWGSLIQAAAAGGLLWVGWRGVDAWRRESIHQRKTQLADAALVACYEVADILRQMGGRRSLYQGSVSLTREPNEPTWLWHTREAFAVVESVYVENAAAFQALRLHRHRAQAVLSEEHALKLDELQSIADWLVFEAMTAVGIAMHISLLDQALKSGEPVEKDIDSAKQSLQQSRELFGMRPPVNGNWMDKDSTVETKIEKAVQAVEAAFRESLLDV